MNNKVFCFWPKNLISSEIIDDALTGYNIWACQQGKIEPQTHIIIYVETKFG